MPSSLLLNLILLAAVCIAAHGQQFPDTGTTAAENWEIFKANGGEEVDGTLSLAALFGSPELSERHIMLPGGDELSTACRIDKRQNLPTFTVDYKKFRAKSFLVQLMNSMCQGMKKNQHCVTNQMRLTYKPSDATTNRKNMCPDVDSQKYCASQDVECDPAQPNMLCNPYANYMTRPIASIKHDPFHLTCDEFPFANSAQGGKPGSGTSICIPGWQNSYQGGKINQLSRRVGAGNDYIIEVTGWDCAKGRPTKSTQCGRGQTKRDELPGSTLNEDDFFHNFTDDGKNALMLYLGDVDAGTYNYTLNVGAGTFSEVRVIDAQGETIAELERGLSADSQAHTVTFQISEEAFELGRRLSSFRRELFIYSNWLFGETTIISSYYS
ncbi:hypothetical protein SAPIO_CDS9515 [Scedosporium apiospermum]|uniref:Deoxyribonuclease NucA/NucB domain-containing protein n=1 Tax=Pseudallescheria apiosperma TaxID=563466 RepID=A0A084FWY8_PSEDA|nr:uncharacterized protein SAPIO_CDS9515 [Scedosporium apiospermum]KEZ39600.1 hypothetical protein SAPIO_CDS9515 [Scedosporium apiospermum]